MAILFARWLAGASHFNNSFDQKCQYLYFGKYWPLESIDSNLYFKLSGGVLLGYKEPYENKIPFNHNGVAPAWCRRSATGSAISMCRSICWHGGGDVHRRLRSVQITRGGVSTGGQPAAQRDWPDEISIW